MSRRAALLLACAAVLLLGAVLCGPLRRRTAPDAAPAAGAALRPHAAAIGFENARARLAGFRSYRALFDRDLVRTAVVQGDGTVRLDVDLRRLAHPALQRRGWSDLEEAIPAQATATVSAGPGGVAESFLFDCPDGCLLDLFAREAGSGAAVPLPLPGTPRAVAVFTLDRGRLADLAFGGRTRHLLRQRADVLEQILGRPVRAPLVEDLGGGGVAALYRDRTGRRDRTFLAFELRRSDRVRSLVDLVLGLAALTRGGSIERHGDVPIGSWSSGSGSVAVAVDGPFLYLASARAPLDEAIELRRDPPLAPASAVPLPDPRGASLALDGGPSCRARLTREGDHWRLDASGDRPLAESEVIEEWLRSVVAGGQRAEG